MFSSGSFRASVRARVWAAPLRVRFPLFRAWVSETAPGTVSGEGGAVPASRARKRTGSLVLAALNSSAGSGTG